jgi:hypothetical protein
VSQCDGVPDADEAEALEVFDVGGGEVGDAVGTKAEGGAGNKEAETGKLRGDGVFPEGFIDGERVGR